MTFVVGVTVVFFFFFCREQLLSDVCFRFRLLLFFCVLLVFCLPPPPPPPRHPHPFIKTNKRKANDLTGEIRREVPTTAASQQQVVSNQVSSLPCLEASLTGRAGNSCRGDHFYLFPFDLPSPSTSSRLELRLVMLARFRFDGASAGCIDKAVRVYMYVPCLCLFACLIGCPCYEE